MYISLQKKKVLAYEEIRRIKMIIYKFAYLHIRTLYMHVTDIIHKIMFLFSHQEILNSLKKLVSKLLFNFWG